MNNKPKLTCKNLAISSVGPHLCKKRTAISLFTAISGAPLGVDLSTLGSGAASILSLRCGPIVFTSKSAYAIVALKKHTSPTNIEINLNFA